LRAAVVMKVDFLGDKTPMPFMAFTGALSLHKSTGLLLG